MNIDLNELATISSHLQDDVSRIVFANRLLYSVTEDNGFLRNVCTSIPEGRDFDNWLSEHENMELILFGAGRWGNWIKNTFDNHNWCCYVDNNIRERCINGIKVIGFEELINSYSNAAIIITSKFYWEEIFDQVSKAGFDIENIYLFGKMITEIESRCYFDLPELKCSEKEVFADVGGYDGNTTRAFSNWVTGEWKSRIFEPGKENIITIKENLKDLKSCLEIIPKGAWSVGTTLFFTEDGVNSVISNEGDVKVDVTTIDNEFADEPCTFIKMDIEGSEIEALKGAERIIKKNRPKLAISVYHKKEDIVEIPKLILRLNPNYKLYLRHYSMTWFDTVLYAI